jgi:hypothetical protein
VAYMPGLLVEMDTDNVWNGAVLDDAGSAQLDSAYLQAGPVTWDEDITAYVRKISIQRGAQRELQRVEAGTATLLLDNRDGRFTAYNEGSPYFPNIVPMKRIRIQGVWSAVTYPIFTGFVETWPVSFPADVDLIVAVDLVDGFKYLSLQTVSGNFGQQTSGERVAAVLLAAGWIGDTDIDTGTVDVPAETLDNSSPLEHIQQIERAEGGRFFIGRDGTAIFRDRQAQINPELGDKTWTDTGSGMSYRDVVLVFNDELIMNDIQLTRLNGTVPQIVQDYDSQARYGIRSHVETGIKLLTDGEVGGLAALLQQRYAEPVLRLESLVDNGMRHQLWDRVLDREINDVVNAVESRTDTAQVSTLEGIAHDIGSDTWTVTLGLSPTVVEVAGVLDDATYGLLDSTAILGR